MPVCWWCGTLDGGPSCPLLACDTVAGPQHPVRPGNPPRIGISRRRGAWRVPPPGARTDLSPRVQAHTLSDTAEEIIRASDERTSASDFFECGRGADESRPAALSLTSSEPPPTGDSRYDALLAAIAEHLASRYGSPGPLWSCTLERFLVEGPWWVSPLPSARAHAMLWTPASFRRRGIYLDRHDLTHDGASPMPESLFDHSEPRRAFSALAEKLERRRIVGQLHVVGGAAIILTYDPTRTATRDIDGLFSPDGPMIAAIREVAIEQGWPSTWLNNQAACYVSRKRGEGSLVFDHPHLQVAATPPRHLLAMKVWLPGRSGTPTTFASCSFTWGLQDARKYGPSLSAISQTQLSRSAPNSLSKTYWTTLKHGEWQRFLLPRVCRQYRIVHTAVGWLLYAGGQQLGTDEGPGEVIRGAFAMQSRDDDPAGTWQKQSDGSYT